VKFPALQECVAKTNFPADAVPKIVAGPGGPRVALAELATGLWTKIRDETCDLLELQVTGLQASADDQAYLAGYGIIPPFCNYNEETGQITFKCGHLNGSSYLGNLLYAVRHAGTIVNARAKLEFLIKLCWTNPGRRNARAFERHYDN
jgi:hypothetical protein